VAKFDLDQFAQTVGRIRAKAIEEGRLRHNLSDEELRPIVEKEPEVKKTVYGNLVAESEPMSRAAVFTKNSVDDNFGKHERDLLVQCEKALAQSNLISVDRIVGNESSETVVRLTVPKEFESNRSKPLPQKDITIRLAMLDDGRVIKIVRNSNYIGEYKKGVFASEDWVAKTKRGGIFLHTGCREDSLQMSHGGYQTTRSLLAALSANGKTTTTGKVLARKRKERSWLVQDDGGTLMPDGSFHGFEKGGIFVKTEDVNPGEQGEIYYGLLKPGTFGENIAVSEDGDFDFYNLETTSNGRAVIQRRDFMHASPYIDVDRIDNLILITREPLVPAIARLSVQQAVAFMALGQAMESSAGDPTRAGRMRTEFFYDPFVAGNKAEHANIFYEILQNLPHMKFYLLNTGGIGEGHLYRDIKLEHTLGILDSLLRGGLEDWVESATGLEVPAAVRVVDEIYFHPEILYSRTEFDEKHKELNRFRRETIEKLGGGLHSDIRNVF